jgi:hypothetical protein
MELMVVLSRRIWLRRNRFIFESIFTHPQVVFTKAVALLDEYHRYNRRQDEHIINNRMRCSASALTRWKPPPYGIVKINWYALVNDKKQLIGIGIVARDNTGNVLGAQAVTKHVVAAPKVAEAMAALEAVLFCKATSFFR